jgi:hypothetical protein
MRHFQLLSNFHLYIYFLSTDGAVIATTANRENIPQLKFWRQNHNKIVILNILKTFLDFLFFIKVTWLYSTPKLTNIFNYFKYMYKMVDYSIHYYSMLQWCVQGTRLPYRVGSSMFPGQLIQIQERHSKHTSNMRQS